MIIEMMKLLAMDAILLIIVLLIVVPFCIFRKAAFAVLRRNFVGYFSNPTGYVFLCLFVVLSSLAAFAPPDFFNNNLANLDQLNNLLPLIMLLFIPAITMAIWSEERKEGTDELLLTLPADDLDIVLGKFIAAASVFSVSLLFSQLCNVTVLAWLAANPQGGLLDLDVQLLFANYIGYWLMGLAMLAVGMIASFLSVNLTVAFVFGVLFNAPLVAMSYANWFIPAVEWSQPIQWWSIGGQFDPFTRGVISVASIIYFVMLTAASLYLCMVLIGKRHWYVRASHDLMILHYAGRFVAILVIAVSLHLIVYTIGFRVDISQGQVSSIGRETKDLIAELDPKHPIRIDAFLSAKVPDIYVRTKTNLINMLKEFRSKNIKVRIHDNLELHSEELAFAEDQFNITPQSVMTRRAGKFEEDEIMMGAAFRSGLERVVVPFFDYGLSVEYELARSIATVAKQERKTLGVVETEAQLTGGGFVGGRVMQREAILTELEKQYEIESVNPASPIDVDKYDVLMVVQPSSLDPNGMTNLLAALRAGVPTAIFEDPRPEFLGHVTPTSEMRRSRGPMPGMGGRPQPKGDIEQLWRLLGISVPGEKSIRGPGKEPDLVWQRYKPYPKLARRGISDAWVFASTEGISEKDPVTSGLREIFFPVPGAIEEDKRSDNQLEFTSLVSTDANAGRISYRKYVENARLPGKLKTEQGAVKGKQTIAARIKGPLLPTRSMTDREVALQDDKKDKADKKDGDKKDGEEKEEKKEPRPLHVIYVADIDLMFSAFFNLRARPDELIDIKWKFENVTFLLNIVDSLAGDDGFVEIRKRQPRYSTLHRIEQFVDDARAKQEEQRRASEGELNTALDEAKEDKVGDELQKQLETLQAEGGRRDQVENAAIRLRIHKSNQTRALGVTTEGLQREFRRKVRRIRAAADRQIQNYQMNCILAAVLIPPIPPLLIGLTVFILRRVREREGVERERLR